MATKTRTLKQRRGWCANAVLAEIATAWRRWVDNFISHHTGKRAKKKTVVEWRSLLYIIISSNLGRMISAPAYSRKKGLCENSMLQQVLWMLNLSSKCAKKQSWMEWYIIHWLPAGVRVARCERYHSDYVAFWIVLCDIGLSLSVSRLRTKHLQVFWWFTSSSSNFIKSRKYDIIDHSQCCSVPLNSWFIFVTHSPCARRSNSIHVFFS